ncbi:MAG: orotate phosphoribosyltransferase [Candidatus Moranbacteria bacterium RBG_13_45_13]|nr:MAG: orotate phosphoribosyltransferase [Candidatus Moranbacteria bacterium RBG_13_45_13]
MNFQQEVARALLKIDAVGFKPHEPITFVSGLKSPIYVDNRKFPFHPEEWKIVINGFEDTIKQKKIKFDVIAGIATGGIPHSSTLGHRLNKPSVYIRKESKGHGKGKKIEGGNVKGKKVLLIEDLVTTGGSSLAGVKALREEGAIVNDCLVIISYGFEEAKRNFEKEKVRLHSLTSFPVVLKEALEMKKFLEGELKILEDWLGDPHGWAERHGF